jgi:hypothetical protein
MSDATAHATIGAMAPTDLGDVRLEDQTTSLRALDAQLEKRAEILSEAAHALPDIPPPARDEVRRRVFQFLAEVVEHLTADDRELYPRVVERLGDPLAVAPMHYESRAIRWWIAELSRTDIAETESLQRLLYGLHALIKVHLSREEELYASAIESSAWPAGS